MKLVEFVDADGEVHFFDPLAVVYVGSLSYKLTGYGTDERMGFKVIYMGGAVNLMGDRDEFVRLVQKRRGM